MKNFLFQGLCAHGACLLCEGLKILERWRENLSDFNENFSGIRTRILQMDRSQVMSLYKKLDF